MKSMTCNELGGACEKVFKADTFDQIAKLSQKHGQEMFEGGDADHLKAMEVMTEMMSDPQAMQDWMDGKKKEFEQIEA